MSVELNDVNVGATSRFGSFREKFQQQLDTQEMKFLMNVFGKTSLRFFCFGLFVFGLNVILESLIPSPRLTLYYVMALLPATGGGISLWFMRRRYDANPLAASAGLKMGIVGLTSFIFIALFMVLLHLFQTYILFDEKPLNKAIAGAILTAFSFGTAWLIYLIPMFVAWFYITRKQAIKLDKFMWGCIMVLLPITIAVMLGMFLGGELSFLWFLIGIGWNIIFMICVVVTLYRFKVVSHTIDYTNEFEKKQWADYFGFVMLEQMLVIALKVMEIAVKVLARSR